MKHKRLASAIAAMAVAAVVFCSTTFLPADFLPAAPGSPGEANEVYAEGELPASGNWGDCTWDIDTNGVLTIHGGSGTAKTTSVGFVPWGEYKSKITAVKSEGLIKCGSSIVRLFYECPSPKTVEGLEGWDVSSVTTMHDLFGLDMALKSISGMEN